MGLDPLTVVQDSTGALRTHSAFHSLLLLFDSTSPSSVGPYRIVNIKKLDRVHYVDFMTY